MSVGFQLHTGAVTPLTLTVPLDPRLLPVMVIAVPTPPLTGDIPDTLGVPGTLKMFVCRSGCPPTVTTTFPVVAPVGTLIVIVPAAQVPAVPAGSPLKVTVLEPCGLPKPLPRMVTNVPTAPVVGDRLVTLGTVPVTVKVCPLLAIPFEFVTTMGPVVAPAGTVAVMLLAPQVALVTTPYRGKVLEIRPRPRRAVNVGRDGLC
jgi:hypothetical protein